MGAAGSRAGHGGRHSVLLDWIKGQVTAIESGLLAFDHVFLPYMLTDNGQTVAERIGKDALLLEVLLSAPPDVRVNEAVLMSTTMAKLYGGVFPRTKYVPKRHGPSLTEALRVVHNGKVTWRNGARGARRVLVAVRDWPGSYDSDEPLSFDLRLPPGSRRDRR